MRLIENARQWWRFWSMRLNALGLFILSWVQFDPVSVLSVWNMMPGEVRAVLPAATVKVIGLVLVGLGLLARLIVQPNLKEK